LTGLGWTALNLGHLGCCHPTCLATSQTSSTDTGSDTTTAASDGARSGRDGILRLAKRHGRAATVLATVPINTLAGADDQPGWLDGHGPITATTARRIAADATLRRLLTDPATGEVLEYGHTTYAPPAALAAFVTARDATCRFPTCDRPSGEADIDHVVPYRHGGTTGATNTWLLHRAHHLDRTHHGHIIRTDPDGTRWWTTPAGFTYPTEPEAIGPITASRPTGSTSAPGASQPLQPPPF
ncbi:HNH endonuclease signature motif containing protein, partial [Jiangella asiatica]